MKSSFSYTHLMITNSDAMIVLFEAVSGGWGRYCECVDEHYYYFKQVNNLGTPKQIEIDPPLGDLLSPRMTKDTIVHDGVESITRLLELRLGFLCRSATDPFPSQEAEGAE